MDAGVDLRGRDVCGSGKAFPVEGERQKAMSRWGLLLMA